MNKQHHIEELERKIQAIKAEPIKGWLHKMSKSIKVKHIQMKIDSLKKKHHGK